MAKTKRSRQFFGCRQQDEVQGSSSEASTTGWIEPDYSDSEELDREPGVFYLDSQPRKLKEADVENLRKLPTISAGIHLSLFTAGEIPSRPPRGSVAFTAAVLRAGIPLPLPNIITKCLATFGLAPAQLSPNSYRAILSLAILFAVKGWPEITVERIQRLYKMKHGARGQHHMGCLQSWNGPNIIAGIPRGERDWQEEVLLVEGQWRSQSQLNKEWAPHHQFRHLTRWKNNTTKPDPHFDEAVNECRKLPPIMRHWMTLICPNAMKKAGILPLAPGETYKSLPDVFQGPGYERARVDLEREEKNKQKKLFKAAEDRKYNSHPTDGVTATGMRLRNSRPITLTKVVGDPGFVKAPDELECLFDEQSTAIQELQRNVLGKQQTALSRGVAVREEPKEKPAHFQRRCFQHSLSNSVEEVEEDSLKSLDASEISVGDNMNVSHTSMDCSFDFNETLTKKKNDPPLPSKGASETPSQTAKKTPPPSVEQNKKPPPKDAEKSVSREKTVPSSTEIGPTSTMQIPESDQAGKVSSGGPYTASPAKPGNVSNHAKSVVSPAGMSPGKRKLEEWRRQGKFTSLVGSSSPTLGRQPSLDSPPLLFQPRTNVAKLGDGSFADTVGQETPEAAVERAMKKMMDEYQVFRQLDTHIHWYDVSMKPVYDNLCTKVLTTTSNNATTFLQAQNMLKKQLKSRQQAAFYDEKEKATLKEQVDKLKGEVNDCGDEILRLQSYSNLLQQQFDQEREEKILAQSFATKLEEDLVVANRAKLEVEGRYRTLEESLVKKVREAENLAQDRFNQITRLNDQVAAAASEKEELELINQGLLEESHELECAAAYHEHILTKEFAERKKGPIDWSDYKFPGGSLESMNVENMSQSPSMSSLW